MSRVEGFAPIPTWMLRDKNVSRRACLVYASLSSRSGLGAIFPSQATIAEEAGVSERTVRSALNELEALGVVERISRRGKEGHATAKTNAYLLRPNGRYEETADIAVRSKGAAKGPATSDEATGNELQPLLYKAEIEEAESEATPRKRGARIPEPFMLTAPMKEWAASEVPGLDVASHTREFVDHWRAASGQSAVKRDWVAAWRNWMRKASRWTSDRAAGRSATSYEQGAQVHDILTAREQRAVTA